MESKGLKPLPVFHWGSDFEILKEYAKKYPYMALGGMVLIARNKIKLFQFLDKCFSIIGRRKVHGFGMTGIELLQRYPFYSVDSTSWLGGSMRSEIYEFKEGKMLYRSTKNIDKADYKSIRYNCNDKKKKWFDRVVNNAIEWKKFENYLTELWKKRGVVWQ